MSKKSQIYWLRRPPFNPLVGFATFYALDWLEAKVERMRWKRAVFERLWEEVRAFREFFNKKLADLLSDYLALICFGEARWAISNSNGPWVFDIFLKPPQERLDAYEIALNFDPDKFLPLCRILFAENDWNVNYGGEAWAELADIACRRSQLSDRLFCDRVIQLQHNTGCCFNKHSLIQHKTSLPNALLDFSYTEPEEWLQFWPTNSAAARLLRRAKRLGLLETEDEIKDKELLFPPRLEWGERCPRLLKITGSVIAPIKTLEGREKK